MTQKSKNEIFNTIKQEMITHIENAKLDTLDNTEQTITELFRFAFYLKETVNECEPHEEAFISASAILEKENIGVLQEKLVHGFVETPDGRQIFTPESIIRKHNFEHGDVIEFDTEADSSKHKPTYTFALIKKRDKQHLNNKTLFKHAVIDHDPKNRQFTITQDVKGQPLIINGRERTYVLSEADLAKYNLTDNSIVDLAWYNNSYKNTARIVWHH